MKAKQKAWAGALVFVLLCIFGFSYFHVSGKEIIGVAAMDESCEVMIYHVDMFDPKNEGQRFVLSPQQIGQLKAFLLDSTFIHCFPWSNGAATHNGICDNIHIFFNDHQDGLLLDCLGGEYMSVHSSFGRSYCLKIINKNWNDELEKIFHS